MTEIPNNIILLSADALRADHLSCYGYDRETSPNIDQLYSESISFNHAYSASSHTREAIPALLTGQYPDRAVDDSYRLQSETIASVLSDQGYKTAGFHSNPYVSRAFGFNEGFDRFYDDLYLGGNKFIALAQRALDLLLNRHYARAEKINRLSLSWLDSIDSDESFFLWNHYMDTHGPYEPPARFDTFQRHSASSNFDDPKSLYKRSVSDPESISNRERDHLLDSYDGEIRYLDHYIGEFIEEIESRGLLEDTLVIFTSDHGDAFGEHGYYGHPRKLDKEVTHVPLLVKPGHPSPCVSETFASTVDICNTIFDLVSGPTDENTFSLLHPSKETRSIFIQAKGEDESAHVRRYAVRSDEGACYSRHNQDTGTIEFGDCQPRKLRDELETHIRGREGIRDSERHELESDENEDIEHRLSALGYK